MMHRHMKLIRALSCGALTLGWLQAFEMVSFSEIATMFITMLLSALVTMLFGGDASMLMT